ncbi:MAG: hypothetical protein B7X41_18295, partial [Microbacterium sp. 14-71-5]
AHLKLIPGTEAYVAVAEDGTFGDRHKPTTTQVSDLGDDSDEDEGVKVKRYMHLTVLAANRVGWQNLVRISNAAEHTRFGKYPLMDLELLAEHREGLIILTGCLGGPVLGPVASGNVPIARANLSALIDAVGAERVHVEVMEHGIAAETAALAAVHALAVEFGVPVVATNDAHYARATDAPTHDAWLALRTKATLDDPNRYRFTGTGYHLRTEAEMRALFEAHRPAQIAGPLAHLQTEQVLDEAFCRAMLRPGAWDNDGYRLACDIAGLDRSAMGDVEFENRTLEVKAAMAALPDSGREFLHRLNRELGLLETFGRPSANPHHPRNWWGEAVDNAARVADLVSADVMPSGKPMLPAFPTPDGYTSNAQYLFELVQRGAHDRYGAEVPAAVRERLNTEWKVIASLGFIDYFLIDHDFVSFAKSPLCAHAFVHGSCDEVGCDGTKAPILTGPGRGSAAGACISYCLGITGIDPLEHDLLFERFLEPGRADFPDIDIDFESNRREDVLDYLTLRWGEGYVALIGSLGVSKSR